jgi:hypothetical protein
MTAQVDLLFAARRAHRAVFAEQALDQAALAAVQTETERGAQFEFAWRRFHDLMHGFDRSFGVSWFGVDGFAETAFRTAPGGRR